MSEFLPPAQAMAPAPGEVVYKLIQKGEVVDMTRLAPTLRHLVLAGGWEQKIISDTPTDVDLSCFLLGKDGITRVDEDFVFYNNQAGSEGAVKHTGDSRTGAGEGDDETITVDLNALPYDVTRLVVVLSIYDENYDGKNFSGVRDVFVRLVNADDGLELLRFIPDEAEMAGANVCQALALVREGPLWLVEGVSIFSKGGLAEIAKAYGLVIREEVG